MIRLVTSLNWVLGTLLLGVALVFPLAHERWFGDDDLIQAVQAIAEAEREHLKISKGDYVYFSSTDSERGLKRLNLDPSKVGSGPWSATPAFFVEAFADGGVLVIRALRHTNEVRKGWRAPNGYELKIKSEGDAGSGAWTTFSNRRPLSVTTLVSGG